MARFQGGWNSAQVCGGGYGSGCSRPGRWLHRSAEAARSFSEVNGLTNRVRGMRCNASGSRDYSNAELGFGGQWIGAWASLGGERSVYRCGDSVRSGIGGEGREAGRQQ